MKIVVSDGECRFFLMEVIKSYVVNLVLEGNKTVEPFSILLTNKTAMILS